MLEGLVSDLTAGHDLKKTNALISSHSGGDDPGEPPGIPTMMLTKLISPTKKQAYVTKSHKLPSTGGNEVNQKVHFSKDFYFI